MSFSRAHFLSNVVRWPSLILEFGKTAGISKRRD